MIHGLNFFPLCNLVETNFANIDCPVKLTTDP